MEKNLSLLPAVPGSGFRMEGYYVWCGSVYYENGKYYLYAARWQEEKTFPLGYLTDSEIVLAVTDDLRKPFRFDRVLITKRDGGYWDSCMAHNPYIAKIGGKYVLFYIGSPDGGIETRAVGYAVADSPEGPFVRSEKALSLPQDANNPAVLEDKDGSLLLYFRDGDLHVSVARAEKLGEPFTVLKFNLFPQTAIEDMFVYRTKSGYRMIAEDAIGGFTGTPKAGVSFSSSDGINWTPDTPPMAYDFDVDYEDGTHVFLQRRERPFVLFGEDKNYLFTTAKVDGPDMMTGGKTYNMVQEIEKGLPEDIIK